MQLSIVATMYNSERYVQEFVERAGKSASAISDCHEIILVDDGSPDSSLAVAKAEAHDNPRLKIIELSKNYGHHRAMLTGLAHSSGDYVFLTDIDLEEQPENLLRFWEEFQADEELDVVYGEQGARETPWPKKVSSQVFYLLFNAMSDIQISDRELVSRLMNRRFVDSLLGYEEESLFLPAIWTAAGFKQKAVLAEKSFDGISSYSFRKRLTLAIDAVTSFSAQPLVFVFYAGMILSMMSGSAIVYFVVKKLILGTPLLGWTSLIASIFLMGGLILSCLGVIGIYISKIFLEVKSRPSSIVRAIHQSEGFNEVKN